MLVSKNAETIRRLRREAIARGDCYACRCRPVKAGSRYCVDCLKRGDVFVAKRIAKRLCFACGVRLPRSSKDRRFKRCQRCRNKALVRDAPAQAMQRDAAIANGICGRCRTRPLKHPRKQCAECLLAGTQRQRDLYRATENPRPKCFRCGRCDQEGHIASSANCPLRSKVWTVTDVGNALYRALGRWQRARWWQDVDPGQVLVDSE